MEAEELTAGAMAPTPDLHGYRYSAYTRVARLALLLKGVPHRTIETDPFGPLPPSYRERHPFGRVPALTHGDVTIFETNAITRYVDRAFAGPALQPGDPVALARMDQVIAVVDAYGYWPMVRQVASHGFFRASFGELSDPGQVGEGLKASAPVLSFLDRVATGGQALNGRDITLADCHLAPMIDYFVRVGRGQAALAAHPALHDWWRTIRDLPAVKLTDPVA